MKNKEKKEDRKKATTIDEALENEALSGNVDAIEIILKKAKEDEIQDAINEKFFPTDLESECDS